MEKTEEHLHVDTTKTTIQGAGTTRPLHGDPSVPTPQTANPEKQGQQGLTFPPARQPAQTK